MQNFFRFDVEKWTKIIDVRVEIQCLLSSIATSRPDLRGIERTVSCQTVREPLSSSHQRTDRRRFRFDCRCRRGSSLLNCFFHLSSRSLRVTRNRNYTKCRDRVRTNERNNGDANERRSLVTSICQRVTVVNGFFLILLERNKMFVYKDFFRRVIWINCTTFSSVIVRMKKPMKKTSTDDWWMNDWTSSPLFFFCLSACLSSPPFS